MGYPEDLKYTDSHEYVRLEEEIVTIGITAFAVQELGEIVFVELPKVGGTFNQGDEVGTIESVKAVSEFYAPVSGTVVEINESVVDDPELLNDDPFGEGWLIKLRISDASDLANLLTSDQYSSLIQG